MNATINTSKYPRWADGNRAVMASAFSSQANEVMERLMREQRDRHSWYVGLVVRSKMADVLSGGETDEEIAAMLTPIKEPGLEAWHWLLWEGCKLIGWRHPLHTIDAMRVTDDGAHMLTYVEYMR
jgi:hypothetical protein